MEQEEHYSGKIVVYDDKGGVIAEYTIDHTKTIGGPQVFFIGAGPDDSDGDSEVRTIAHCSRAFLAKTLVVQMQKAEWLRSVIDVVSRNALVGGIRGYLKSPNGSFALGLWAMMGVNMVVDGIFAKYGLLYAIVGAMLAVVTIYTHFCLPISTGKGKIET